MKRYSYLKFALVAALVLLMAACRSSKVVENGPSTAASNSVELLKRVCDQALDNVNYVSSKMKFSATVGGKDVSLSGTLRMKRNDVIRLQLMALGLVEAARMEFTQDYVLIMDRINKQYIKAAYADVDFLRDSGLNFNSLQALFWGELFQPGKQSLDAEALQRFDTAQQGEGESVVSFQDGEKARMRYSWLVNSLTGRIKTVNVTHNDAKHGNTSLDWSYREYKALASKQFPSDVQAIITMPTKDMKLDIKLSSLSTDSDWETRTNVSSKYSKVDVDDILKRLTSL